MTAAGFRRIVLALDGVIESAHMGHPDFRVNGRIFATLKHDNQHGMVKLTPAEQTRFIRAHPDTFAPESGAWGRAGCTRVTLKSVDEEVLGEALTLAWQHTVNAPSRPARRAASTRTRRK